jgi:hypothetical protein
MEYFRPAQAVSVHIARFIQHIRAGVSIEDEVGHTLLRQRDKRQCGARFLIEPHTSHIYPILVQGIS